MEEKERYEYYLGTNSIKDNTTNSIYDYVVDLLNQQSKRIKELEEELDDAKRDYIPKLEFGLQRANKMGRDAEEENQQLKEKLNNFETCMKKYNVEDIEHLALMLFVLSGETKYHLKEIKDKHKKELKQSQKQLAIEELEKVKEYNHTLSLGGSPYIDVFINNQIARLKKEGK